MTTTTSYTGQNRSAMCRQAVHQTLDAVADLRPDDIPPKTASRRRLIQARRRKEPPVAEAGPTTTAVEVIAVALDQPHLHACWGPATPETREGGRAPVTAIVFRAQTSGVLRRRREEDD